MEIHPEYSLKGLMLKLKLQYFGNLIMNNWFIEKDPDAGKDWGHEQKGLTEDEMVGQHHQVSGLEFEQILGDSEGQGSLVCCSPWVHKGLDTTEWLKTTLQHSRSASIIIIQLLLSLLSFSYPKSVTKWNHKHFSQIISEWNDLLQSRHKFPF